VVALESVLTVGTLHHDSDDLAVLHIMSEGPIATLTPNVDAVIEV
jgi:hypothetical protein